MGTPGKLPFHADPPGDWIYDAACQGKNGDLFFPERGFEAAAYVEAAKAICAGCDVRQPCLEYAVRTHTNVGVWGGLSAYERRNKRGRGRKKAS
jgi:WhiB family redox-sensing transcriptional regulator